jgi:hypothetical protein
VLCAGEDDDDRNKTADGCDESTKPTMINSIPIMMSYLVESADPFMTTTARNKKRRPLVESSALLCVQEKMMMIEISQQTVVTNQPNQR